MGPKSGPSQSPISPPYMPPAPLLRDMAIVRATPSTQNPASIAIPVMSVTVDPKGA